MQEYSHYSSVTIKLKELNIQTLQEYSHYSSVTNTLKERNVETLQGTATIAVSQLY